MRQYTYYMLVRVFSILILVVCTSPAFGGNLNSKLELVNNKLSISAQEIPLGSLLKEIGDKTGIQFIVGEEESVKTFSGNFRSLTIEEAIDRVFEKIDHVIFYSSDDKILMVRAVSKCSAHSAKLEKGVKKLQSDYEITVNLDGNAINAVHEAVDINAAYESCDMNDPYEADGMYVTHEADGMYVTHEADGMNIIYAADDMVVT